MLRLKSLRVLAIVGGLSLLLTACPADEPVVEPTPEPEDPEPEPEPEPEPDEPVDEPEGLLLGYLLPETGDLAFLGPAQIRAVEMAVADINEAGGVFGADVTVIGGDEAGDAAVASTEVDRLLGEGVHAVIGAAASGMSLAVIDQIVGAGVLQCSASNTSPTFTTYDDGGMYFRTAPSDALQGPVLAETVLADGHSRVAVMARGDDYGEALADSVIDSLEEAGAEVVERVIYDPAAATFSAEIEQVAAADPEAIVTIPFVDDGIQLLGELIEAGFGPGDVGVYGADGIRSSGLNELIDPTDPNVIDGFKGTAPDTEVDPEWRERFDEFTDGEEPIFSAQAYDCVTLVALAAVAAGSIDGEAMAAEMIDLTTGDNECVGFAECAELLEAGESIKYVAASGMDAFTDVGEPNGGLYEVWEWADGALSTIDHVQMFLE